MMPLTLVKAHAFGNDFLLVESRASAGRRPICAALARAMCDRVTAASAPTA